MSNLLAVHMKIYISDLLKRDLLFTTILYHLFYMKSLIEWYRIYLLDSLAILHVLVESSLAGGFYALKSKNSIKTYFESLKHAI